VNEPESTWTDYRIEQLIGRLLQLGVLAAAIVTLFGGVLLLLQHGSTVPDYSVFRGEPGHLTSIGGILAGVRAFRSESIVQLGLLLLVATPVARVACTLVAFIFQRDRTYVVVTTIVLAVLLYGLVFGKA
jgi:Predicted membrane protein